MIKKIIFFLIFTTANIYSYCLVYPCDSSIVYAMGRYSDKTTHRVNDYKKTITASKKIDEVYGKVLDEQSRELAKLLSRLMIENLLVSKIKKDAKTLKQSSKRYN